MAICHGWSDLFSTIKKHLQIRFFEADDTTMISDVVDSSKWNSLHGKQKHEGGTVQVVYAG